MIRNYIKIAWRNLLRQKLYSLINISGLAVGLCVCMLIMLYVAHEYSFDGFHANANKIYALDEHATMGGNSFRFANTNFITGPTIKQNNGNVAAYMRIHEFDDAAIISNPNSPSARFTEKDLISVDANFFSFFSFKLLSGAANDVLSKPNSLVISEEAAKKYFGDENPIGKILNISLDSTYLFEVTGVAKNAPSNTAIQYGFIMSNSALNSIKQTKDKLSGLHIGSGEFKTYMKLNNISDTASVQRTMKSLLRPVKSPDSDEMILTSLPQLHIKSNYGDNSNLKYLNVFPLIAGLILLLALVNYMSLATARASVRAKEIGVRKVNGAGRASIAMQFYIESAMYAVISFVLAYLLCYLLAGKFLALLALKIDTAFLYSNEVIAIMAGMLLLTVVIAGSYPAIVLSAFKPVITLKGNAQGNKGITVRKVFTTGQFAISVGLIICGIIIDRQLYFFRHNDTGVNRENVLIVPYKKTMGPHYLSFKKDISALAGVEQVATAQVPLYKYFDVLFVSNEKNESIVFWTMYVDKPFIKELGLKWKIPPTSDKELSTLEKIVVNEAAITKLNIKGNPIGQTINTNRKYQIVGVLKDFNALSMERAIEPTSIVVLPDEMLQANFASAYAYIKIRPNTNMPGMLAAIKKVYQQYDKSTPFEYDFLDDFYNKQYKAEERLSYLFSSFIFVTIILAALGLFGLAAFTIEQRTKEIGIRKVLGASLLSINTLLSADFMKLVVLSIAIASPVAWWAMHKWLQNFVFRISIQWWVFAAAGVVAVVVALLAISYHSIKAAVLNPVKSLRND